MTPFRSFLCPVLVGALSALPAFAADGDLAYRVQQGDTLLTLSRELLTPPHNWRDLKARNRVADVQRIPAGTLLQVPASWTRAERLSARVERIHGKVTANGSPLSVGNVVSAGAVLRSGEDSFATLALPDGSKLTLQPDSEATMERLQHYRGFDGFDTSLAVTRGRIDTQAAKQRGPAARYRITTPSAVIGVRGTEFRVAAEGESLARAEVTEGEVAVSPAEGGSRAARALPAGFGIVARAGQPIPVPRALLPAPLLAGLPALQERLALRFPFAAVAGAHAYRVQLAADAGFRDLLAEGVFATPLARFGELPDGSYWLRARAIDDDGLEGLDAVRQFVVHARPLPPMATGPANGAKLRTEEVSFGWLPSGEAARYRLQVARDAAFSELVGSESETEASAVRMHLPVGDYQWRLASVGAEGAAGPWSDGMHVAVRPLPGEPAPPAIGDDTLSFTWPAEPGQHFRFQFARDAGFSDLLADAELAEPAASVPRPAQGRYFVRVRATDPDGFVGPFTPAQDFVVPAPRPWWMLAIPLLMLF